LANIEDMNWLILDQALTDINKKLKYLETIAMIQTVVMFMVILAVIFVER